MLRYRSRQGRAWSSGSRRVLPCPTTRAVWNAKLLGSLRSISTRQTHWSGYREQISAQLNGSEIVCASFSATFIVRSSSARPPCQVSGADEQIPSLFEAAGGGRASNNEAPGPSRD